MVTHHNLMISNNIQEQNILLPILMNSIWCCEWARRAKVWPRAKVRKDFWGIIFGDIKGFTNACNQIRRYKQLKCYPGLWLQSKCFMHIQFSFPLRSWSSHLTHEAEGAIVPAYRLHNEQMHCQPWVCLLQDNGEQTKNYSMRLTLDQQRNPFLTTWRRASPLLSTSFKYVIFNCN